MTFKTVMCCHLYDFFFMSMSPWEQNSEFYYFTLVETWDNLPYENLRSAFEQKGEMAFTRLVSWKIHVYGWNAHDFSKYILEWKSTQPVLSGRPTSKLWKWCFFKVVKCFEIVTDFCSPGTSFFLLAGPCPVSLAFLHTRPQGRCENRGKRSHLRAFESQPPRPPCSQKGQLCTSSGSGRIFAEGVPQPGDMTGALCAAGRREVAADVMRA